MAQGIFNDLKNNQRKGTKHIIFQQNNDNQRNLVPLRVINQEYYDWDDEYNDVYQQEYYDLNHENRKIMVNLPFFSFSDGVLNINSDSEKLKGELDLSPFPNLRKITFQGNAQFNFLESIDLSKNQKLSKIIILNQNQNQFFRNNDFILLIKEMQSNRIILSYYEDTSRNVWIEKYKYLQEQTIIPYILVEDGQLETEIAELRQSLNYKDQIITDLNKKIQQTPTLNQFQELNNIALGHSELNFNKLKQEIKRLKLKDFNPYFQEQKNTFERLMITTKNRAGDSLKSILDLLLRTNNQIIESEDGNKNNSFTQGQLQGQLTSCQTLLQTKFTPEELQSLLDKQKEFGKLEKHFVILQQDIYKQYV
ncbi:14117_t:CDS:1 [Gigaspora margarita]|uniref:14117_t:CDS:1 n=1 Tax=Gigaspora margarita TaxID=4874 RepID=A0ABN7UUA5_GIGMA|nr:14117_t:CDS:1 [Gigaspora margarita]